MNILELFKEYDTICLFRHQVADADALGSQFGLKSFIEQVYPDKKVYALGESLGSCAYLFPSIDTVSDEVVKQSLAVVLDSANVDRIDDQRFATAKKIIKIDHHVVVEDYANESYVDITASATCEVLANAMQTSGVAINEMCAKYLYLGLLADSGNFTTTNTTANTLRIGSYLVSCGLQVNKILQERTNLTLTDFHYTSLVRSKAQVNGKVIFAVINREDYKKFGYTYNEAKEKVFCMANINEMEMWCLFTQDEFSEEVIYHGSLRSKNYAINEVANTYNGGGHKNACGVKNLTLDTVMQLVNDLNGLVK